MTGLRQATAPPRVHLVTYSTKPRGGVVHCLELADALHRNESCGGHFREEYQTPDGEALRDDEKFCYVAGWEFKGDGVEPVAHKEPLSFEHIKLAQRSYK